LFGESETTRAKTNNRPKLLDHRVQPLLVEYAKNHDRDLYCIRTHSATKETWYNRNKWCSRSGRMSI